MAIQKIKVSQLPYVTDTKRYDAFVQDAATGQSARITAESLRGNTGDNAFELWQKQPGNAEKTYEDYLAFNRQPATEAGKSINQLESDIRKKESARIESENERIQNEQRRTKNESARESAEKTRKDAESLRVETERSRIKAETTRDLSEQARLAAEIERIQAESVRKDTEEERIESEQTRIENETVRIKSEETRDEAEKIREQAETLRLKAETARDLKESERIQKESERIEAEEERKIQETIRRESEISRNITEENRKQEEAIRNESERQRVDSERQRETAEQERIIAENERKTDSSLAIENMRKATREAIELNDHQAKIIKGEWWVYDLSTHEYINSGLPARGEIGKPLKVNAEGNYMYWDEASEQYVDSGVEAVSIIDLDNFPVNFREATIRENIQTSETVPTLFGKIKKWFSDLGRLAWKNTVDYNADIDNLPEIPAAQIQADYAQTDNEQRDFIKNKPYIPIKTSDLIKDDVYTKSQTQEQIVLYLGTVYKPKGSVDDYSKLPTVNTIGDVYNTRDTGDNYVWVDISEDHPDGWDKLAGDVDLSDYYTMEEAWKTFSGKAIQREMTLLPSGWSGAEDLWSYTVEDEQIIDGCLFESWPADRLSKDAAFKADVDENIFVSDGSFTITAVYKPTNPINLIYTIIP